MSTSAQPYLLMAILFASLGTLAAVDSALSSLGLLPFLSGIRWLRVHLITLGTLVEVLFGVLPILVAIPTGRSRLRVRWDIWLTLNLGLIILLVGIPLVSPELILAGGVLIVLATALLLHQLRALEPGRAGNILQTLGPGSTGRWFYLAGLGFLLVGITVGTGLWLGWAAPLRIATPTETHIHANVFGFLALTLTGLIVDLYPDFAGRALAWPGSIRAIFVLMVLGAFALVLGPWLAVMPLTLLGVLLHLSATVWLLFNMTKPLLDDRRAWSPGPLHLITSYLWFLAPLLVAPLIILNVVVTSAGAVEQSAPQALIYGWALQIGYALIPFLVSRLFLPGQPARLGGSWLSLVSVHLGALALWASILVAPWQAALHAIAYLFWALSMLSILAQIWRIVREGIASSTLARGL